MKKKFKVAVVLISVSLFFSPSPSQAQDAIHKKFSNCAELNKVYPGGVAKSSKVRNKGGTTKRVPTVNAKVYAENSSKDRDNDGIACEK